MNPADEKITLPSSINSLPFGFMLADISGAIILSNPASVKILEKESAPQSVSELAKIFVNFDIMCNYNECLTSKAPFEIKEIPFDKKFLRIIFVPILGASAITGHAIIFEDITELKAIEKRRDEFFIVASHELRTPLTAIRTSAELMLTAYLDQIPNDDMKQLLMSIDTASIRLIKIVNDYLEAPKLEQGKIQVKKESFNIVEVVNKVVGDMKIIAEKKNIKLSYDGQNVFLPNVFADKGVTEQIIINLISNAMKFTSEGSITITGAVEQDFVKIIVSDTGIGISEKDQPLLFKKFQQTDESFISRGIMQGSGLGLYISQLLISNMGGVVTLEKSELGKGSVFAFTIPIAK